MYGYLQVSEQFSLHHFGWLCIKRISLKNVLIIAFIVQIISISAPLITTNIVVAMLGAIGFGGTFLGIVSLSLAYGRQLSPGGTTTAILTILFSLGQMIGPAVAGFLQIRQAILPFQFSLQPLLQSLVVCLSV